MQIKTLVKIDGVLQEARVETMLLPGLPKIHFLGLPDQSIKECELRIKSAIKNAGFEYPRAKQILVNIEPQDSKKSSVGIELAIAYSILVLSGQIEEVKIQSINGLSNSVLNEELVIYGELTLDGRVKEPADLRTYFTSKQEQVFLTGKGDEIFLYDRYIIENLQQLKEPSFFKKSENYFVTERPSFGINHWYTQEQARLIELIALGEHNFILAGPSGVGKTTVSKAISSFLSEPDFEDIVEILKWNKGARDIDKLWRPLISPHHSATPLALIGGGSQPKSGEVTKAHKGVLILDEYLEFAPKVQEMLREPMQEKVIRLSRASKVLELPCDTIFGATTNLCPCGKWLPREKIDCDRSEIRCRGYRERLSGPVLDRFEIISFMNRSNNERSVSGVELLERIQETREWIKSQAQVNQAGDIKQSDNNDRNVSAFCEENIRSEDFDLGFIKSIRRRNSVVKVARTIANIDKSAKIADKHIDEALNYSWRALVDLMGVS